MMILIVWLRKLKFERIFSFYLHVCNFKFRNSKNIFALRRVSLVFSKLFRSFPNVRQTKGTLPSHLPNCRAVGFGSPLLQNPCSVRYILCWIMAPIVFGCVWISSLGACHLQRVLFTDEGVQKISTTTNSCGWWGMGSPSQMAVLR